MLKRRTRLSVIGASVVVTLLLCAAFAIVAYAFSDVHSGDDYAEAINDLSTMGVIDGKEDGTFRPRELVTRQQFAKMIVLTLGIEATEDDICPFSDVDVSGPSQLYPDNFVAVAADLGITKGKTARSFAPFANITRGQVMSMVVRAAEMAGVALNPPTNSYYTDTRWTQRLFDDPNHGRNAQIAEFNGLLWGIRPDTVGQWDAWKNATRGEVAQILWRLQQKIPSGGTTTTTTELPPSDLLLYDDFSDTGSGWSNGGDGKYFARYDTGTETYVLGLTVPDYECYSWLGSIFDDNGVTVDVKPVPSTGSWEYGLMFRFQDASNFYELTVMGDGYASLWKRVDGEWFQISDIAQLGPAASDGIRHLAVNMIGDSIVAYVDDVGIGPVYDDQFSQGKVGFYAKTYEANSFTAYFDEFAVWAPIVY